MTSDVDMATQSVETEIHRIAMDAARANQDENPTAIQWVRTTYERAENAFKSRVPNENSVEVYLVIVQGQFVVQHARKPRGAPLPRGNVIMVMVDADTFETRRFGLINTAHLPMPQLSEMGEVHHLQP